MNHDPTHPARRSARATEAFLAAATRTLRAPCVALLAVAVVVLPPADARAEGPGDPEVIVEWNELLQRNIPATVSLASFRYYAMLHVAMFDAANSVDGRYEPYRIQVQAPSPASAEAAAAQAARDVLVALIPAAAPAFDAALENRLRTLRPQAAETGAMVGRRVADAIIESRRFDGWEQPNPPYAPPALPGYWQPTAPGQVAALVNAARIKPFGLLTPTQYLPAAPPFLTDARYTEDFNMVKALGSVASTARSEEETLLARLFAGPPNYSPNPFALWSRVARDVSRSQGLQLVERARLFALASVAMHDGLQTAHASKYVYGLWRPVTAIRRADEDLNPLTAVDPAWTPLLGTPPYPSHASNLTCIGASAARAIGRAIRADAIGFSVTWTGLGGNADVTRPYSSLSRLAEEAGLSRVYGGIHFLFEIEASHASCSRVADYIADNHMRLQAR